MKITEIMFAAAGIGANRGEVFLQSSQEEQVVPSDKN